MRSLDRLRAAESHSIFMYLMDLSAGGDLSLGAFINSMVIQELNPPSAKWYREVQIARSIGGEMESTSCGRILCNSTYTNKSEPGRVITRRKAVNKI